MCASLYRYSAQRETPSKRDGLPLSAFEVCIGIAHRLSSLCGIQFSTQHGFRMVLSPRPVLSAHRTCVDIKGGHPLSVTDWNKSFDSTTLLQDGYKNRAEPWNTPILPRNRTGHWTPGQSNTIRVLLHIGWRRMFWCRRKFNWATRSSMCPQRLPYNTRFTNAGVFKVLKVHPDVFSVIFNSNMP